MRKLSTLVLGTLVVAFCAQASETKGVPEKPKPGGMKGGKYTYRSYGAGFFLAQDPKTKANIRCDADCQMLASLERGARIEFLDDMKIIEFSTPLGLFSCETSACREIAP
jgi:hypothetical protein